MKKYLVDYNIYGCIEIEADSVKDAMIKVGNITEDKILEESLTWGMNIGTEDVNVEECDEDFDDAECMIKGLLRSIRDLDKIRNK